MQEFTQGLRRALQEQLASPVEFFHEAMDVDRFAGREESSPLVTYFDDKYRGFGIDVVVPVGGRALASPCAAPLPAVAEGRATERPPRGRTFVGLARQTREIV
jgi:hypothetical protein